jgi:hypothetical protein
MWDGNNEDELREQGWYCITLTIDKITEPGIISLLRFLEEDHPGRWYVQLFASPSQNDYFFEDQKTAVEFALRFGYAS